jgi:predicted nucleic acid binding AN1-type Zn finger protein
MLRCHFCNKKITFIEEITSKCKCNHKFCKEHTLSFLHECSYNYADEYKKTCNSNMIKLDNRIIKI